MKATEIGSQTMVGYADAPFPRQRGNCFSMLGEDGNYYRIVNFGVENLEELIRRKVVEFPVEIELVEDRPYQGQRLAMVRDERIPAEWYNERRCSTCWPCK